LPNAPSLERESLVASESPQFLPEALRERLNQLIAA
jgi:hypothetical protein